MNLIITIHHKVKIIKFYFKIFLKLIGPPIPSVKVIAPQNPHKNSEDSKENTPKNIQKKDISYPPQSQPSFFIQLEKQDSLEKISMRPKKDSLTGSNTPSRKKAISGGSGKFEEHLKRKDTFDDVVNDKINEKLKTDKNLLMNNLNIDCKILINKNYIII